MAISTSKSLCLLSILLLSACAQQPPNNQSETPKSENSPQISTLPYNSIAIGTLVSDESLVNAALDEMSLLVIQNGCETPESYEPFIQKSPKGNIGEKKWSEIWIMRGCENNYPMQINFSESKGQSIRYTISQL